MTRGRRSRSGSRTTTAHGHTPRWVIERRRSFEQASRSLVWGKGPQTPAPCPTPPSPLRHTCGAKKTRGGSRRHVRHPQMAVFETHRCSRSGPSPLAWGPRVWGNFGIEDVGFPRWPGRLLVWPNWYWHADRHMVTMFSSVYLTLSLVCTVLWIICLRHSRRVIPQPAPSAKSAGC